MWGHITLPSWAPCGYAENSWIAVARWSKNSSVSNYYQSKTRTTPKKWLAFRTYSETFPNHDSFSRLVFNATCCTVSAPDHLLTQAVMVTQGSICPKDTQKVKKMENFNFFSRTRPAYHYILRRRKGGVKPHNPKTTTPHTPHLTQKTTARLLHQKRLDLDRERES